MRYRTRIEISQPIDKVIELFQDHAHLAEWQPGFLDRQQLEGKASETSSKSLLRYNTAKRKLEIHETVVSNTLPEEIQLVYHTKGIYNKQINKFQSLPGNKTRWEAENIFRFKGILKLMSLFMKDALVKQSVLYMEHFKIFAERQN